MFDSLLLSAALFLTPQKDTIVPMPPPIVALRNDPNQTGDKPSAYTGKYFNPKQEPYRRCVAHREGRFQYWTTGSNGYYESTYQMTDALVRGAAWMIRPELKKTFGPKKGKAISDRLLETPGRHWSRYYMDMAFYTILNWRGPYSGSHHWSTGHHVCPPGLDHWRAP